MPPCACRATTTCSSRRRAPPRPSRRSPPSATARGRPGGSWGGSPSATGSSAPWSGAWARRATCSSSTGGSCGEAPGIGRRWRSSSGGARPARVLGSPALALSPEGRLLFLAGHAARHRWEGVRWLVDIHEAVRAGGFDPGEVAAAARRWGWEEVLAIGLGACRRLFGTVPPPGLPVREPPRWVRLYPSDLRSRPLASGLDHLRLFRGPRAKLLGLLRLALVPTEAERRLAPLPEGLAPLYWILRPARVAGKFGAILLAEGLRRAAGKRPDRRRLSAERAGPARSARGRSSRSSRP